MSRAADGRLGTLKCIKPYLVNGAIPVRCGGCTECRIFNKLQAALRAELELGFWQSQGLGALVATLTYAPEFLPPGGDLCREDLTSYRKRLQVSMFRKFGLRVRSWGPGEYGEEGMRPHYHVVVFGVDPHDREQREVVSSAWSRGGRPMGMVYVDDASAAGVMEYVAGYCVKKMNRPCPKLQGHVPEFVAWPQRPPLGGALADSIAKALEGPVGESVIARLGQDVPGQIRRGGRLVTLPRTLRRRARALLGLDSPEAKAVRSVYQSCRMQVARADFKGDWFDPQAHVDVDGIERAQARRRIFAGSKRKRSL